MKKGEAAWNKGLKRDKNLYPKMGHYKKHSDETKKKLSISSKGRTAYFKGKKLSKEHKEKLSISHKGKIGEKSSNWRGGITPINKLIRNSTEYKLWRKSVFERDNYTCVWCLKVGGQIHADHIKPFAHYPELRFAIDNGRTLCISCHRTTDTYGGLSKKTNDCFTPSTKRDS